MKWTNLGAIIEDSIRSRLLKSFFKSLGKKECLLDLGCGPRPYFSIYQPYFSKTIGADLADSPFPKKEIDIYCSATEVPLPDESVDVILCTEVIHDLPEPDLFFTEVKRLLKKEGILVMTSPFVVPIVDGTYDHYRYTKHGLTYRIQKSGLEVRSIEEVGDLFGTIITLSIKPILKFFNVCSKTFRLKVIYSIYNPLIFLLAILPQLLYLLSTKIPIINLILKKFRYGAIGYVSIVQKPK
ncbi:MAG: methyltransferase domain-containing protein [Bacteroidetes bacterium]|nr:methyltransferase domain-containing protein [Bacteroidota bacterium]